MMRLNLFCDESGSTGTNFLDPTQPFYVVTGVVVRDVDVERCRALVDAKRQERGARELKGTGTMRAAAGRAFAAELARDLYLHGARIAFVVVEKRFALAGWFVNIFLDADATGRERLEYNRDPQIQTQAANMIARLPLEVLAPTNVAIRDPSEHNQRTARETVVAALRADGENALASEIEASLLPSAALEAQDAHGAARLRLGQTPNTTGYMALLGNVERIRRAINATDVAMVHDETASFEDTYRFYYELVSDPVSYGGIAPWMKAAGYPSVEHVNASFVDSTTEPLVQAADVIAAGLAFVANAAVAGKPRDRSTMALFGLLEKVLVPDDAKLRFKWHVVSQSYAERKREFDRLLLEAEALRMAKESGQG